jgi:alpha-2-macroglobulin
MIRQWKIFRLAALLIIFYSITLFAADSSKPDQGTQPLQILNVTPNGEDVPAGRQIVFQFNRPVVPVGRMDRNAPEIPITITPQLKGQWRWLNTSSLALMLDEKSALAPATKYEIVVRPGIKTEDGATLKESLKYSFITERPGVVHTWFKTWSSPSMPVLRVTFNQQVSQYSVQKHLFILTEGNNRTQIKAEPDPDDKEIPIVLPLPGENLALVTAGDETESSSMTSSVKSFLNKLGESLAKTSTFGSIQTDEDKKDVRTEKSEARRVWLVSPVKQLPLDSETKLMDEPGLESASGPQKGIEKRTLVSFSTFPEFIFKGIECTDNGNKKIQIEPNKASAAPCLCNPMRPASLVFSSPVSNSEMKDHLTFKPNLSGGQNDYEFWDDEEYSSVLSFPHRKGQAYRFALPSPLKGNQTYTVKSDLKNLTDEFGRKLKEPINIAFTTDHRLPDFNLINQIAVLEKGVDSDMPLVVTNLNKLTMTYDRLTAGGKDTSLKRELALPKVKDLGVKIPARVHEMIGGKSGIIQGTLDTEPQISKNYLERWFFAEVTPYQVHVKLGHFNTMAWVTGFATGQPVSGATVKIYKDTYSGLTNNPSIMSSAVSDTDGVATLAGTEKIDPDLALVRSYDKNRQRFFVRVEKGDDIALLPLDQDFNIYAGSVSNYSIWSYMREQYGHIHTWGTTAQGVYRAGDTVQYKLYVRNQSNEAFVPAPSKSYSLKVVDPMGKTIHEVKDIALSDFGAWQGEFTVPKTGAVGWYQFELTASFIKTTWEPMRVLVSDFTPSPFKVTTDLNGQSFKPGDEMKVVTQARLHSGGPYADASTRVTVTLKSRAFAPDNPAARGFSFDTYMPETRPEQIMNQTDGKVDNKGDLTTAFVLSDSNILYGQLYTEGAVRDDRGKYIAASATANFAARDRFVGLKQNAWVLQQDKEGKMDVLVVNAEGLPVAGVPVSLKIEHLDTVAARVKGAGNAYLTQYTHQWNVSENRTVNSTDLSSTFSFTPNKSGLYRVTATIKDTKGKEQSSRMEQWVIGKGEVLWEENEKNSLEIVAEKKGYRVGETARYLVKNPFPGAKALITIERYGVLKHWVQTLDSSTPVIEFKVEKDFIPGYFLSVVIMSPRVDKPLGADEVDLGKPAFRMGYVETPVVDPYKQITVVAKPQKETCKPGDKVKVDLKTTLPYDQGSEPVELAVAVLDEAVFDLIAGGKDYFDPYKGFYTIDGLDVDNYSLILQLVGRQKFEKKGADPAGDGGVELGLRSVFKFVAYWNPSIKPDKDGNATIEFEVPDNLTGWRVIALAVTPTDKMGLGEGHFTVNRPTEIRPVMPNQVTEGDSFMAGFSIMNRTDKTRNLTMTITAKGAIETQAGQGFQQVAKSLTAEPYKRTTVWLPLTAKGDGKIRFTVRGGDPSDQDGVVHELDVNKMASLETGATYGSSASGNVTEPVKFPEDIRTDVGKVYATLSPSVIGNVEGAFGYIRDYPYACWEQKLTKGVMAAHYLNLKKYIPDEFTWDGSKDLPQTTLDLAASYQAPNGGMAYYVPEDRYTDPYLSAYTALAFNWLKDSGYKIPSQVDHKLNEYLLLMLRKDVAPDFYSAGMASTVRAVALAALAKNNLITLDDLRRYQPHLKEMDLFGKAHFMLASIGIKGAEEMRREAFNLIISHSDQTGGKFVFSEAFDDSYSRMLTSSLRTNAAVLSALVAYGKTEDGKTLAGDIPFKMVRYISQTRKQTGRWENTQENMFCMNGLIDYARVYESQKPAVSIIARLEKESLGEAKFKDVRDNPVELKRPIDSKDPGRKTSVILERLGEGTFYYSVGLTYALKDLRNDAVNAGIDVRREYSVERNGKWILLKTPMELKRGELVRVDLYISLPAARNFVVLDDPVPGGLEPVNRDLATSSTVDAGKAKSDYATDSWWFHYGDWSYYGMSRWSFYHQELRHNAAIFYSEYLAAGNYHLSYTAQAIAPGTFTVMPAHAEEMYDPDVFGKSMTAILNVKME